MKHLSTSILTVMLAFLCVFGVEAKKKMPKKVFYDSKSWIVNFFGDDLSWFRDTPMRVKIAEFKMDVPSYKGQPTDAECKAIEAELNKQDYGKKVIDILTDNGTSEATLRKLALANVQKADLELGAENMRTNSGEDVSNLLAEDYLPVLTYNYIIVDFYYTVTIKNSKGDYEDIECINPVIYHVDIDREQAFDIMSSLGEPARYDKLKFNVSFCSKERYYEEIIADVPALAVRGVLTQRNPARISIGSDMGVRKGDLVTFYSQRLDKQGKPYSKRISRARVCKVWPDYAQVNFEANTAGNRKNGDIVVRTPDNHSRMGILATWSQKVWGGKILWDDKSGFTRSGIIHHFLMDLGFSMTQEPGNKFVVTNGLETPNCLRAPMFWNLGMGYGIGKTFLGFMDVMGFFIAQYEGSFMLKNESLMKDLMGQDKYSDYQAKDLYGSNLRIPIGLRLSFNTGYPTKFIIEGGYAVNWAIDKKAKAIKESLKSMDARRDGLFVNIGFIF